MTDTKTDGRQTGRIVFGALLALAGTALLLGKLGYLDYDRLWAIWPLAFIAWGVVRLATPGDGRRGGLWFVTLGGWFALDQVGVLPLDESWPIFIVTAGAIMVWNAVSPRRRVCRTARECPPC